MDNISNQAQLQIRLVSKQQIYAVPDVPLSVPANVNNSFLNKIVNELLKENNSDILKTIEFEFLISNELLKVHLVDFLKEKEISLESVIEIVYFERTPAPKPEDALLHDDWVSGIETADKWILTGCYDNTINIWTIKGQHVLASNEHTNVIKSVRWLQRGNPTEGFISVSHDLLGILWDWNPGTKQCEPKITLRGHERGIDSVGINEINCRVATGGWDTNLKIWSASLKEEQSDAPPNKKFKGMTTRTPLHTLKGHKETITSCIWNEPQTVCTVSMDHTIKFWDTYLCGIKQEIVGQKAFLNASWSPNSNNLLASSADRHIRLYDPRSSEGTICKMTFTSHTSWVSSVTWSPVDEYLFMSGGYDECVKLWDTRSPKAPLYDLKGHQGKVLCVDWSNSNYLVSGGSDNSVHIFKHSQ